MIITLYIDFEVPKSIALTTNKSEIYIPLNKDDFYLIYSYRDYLATLANPLRSIKLIMITYLDHLHNIQQIDVYIYIHTHTRKDIN